MILHKVEIKSGRFVSNIHYSQNNKASLSRRLIKNYEWHNWSANIVGRHIYINGPNASEYPLMDGVLLFCSMKISGDIFYFSRFLDNAGLKVLEKYNISEFVEMDPNKKYRISNLITDGKIKEEMKFGKKCTYVADASFVLEPLLELDENKDTKLSFILYSKEYPTVLEKRLDDVMEVKQ